MLVIGDVIIGLGIAALALLNVYQYGQVREQRAVNEANSLKLAKAELANTTNATMLADMKKPVLITMTEQQVMGLAGMLQSGLEALHATPIIGGKKPN